MNQMDSEREAYYELSCYTLAHADSRFIHQHIVDAFAAQTANEETKKITIAFALIGLYLYVEKDYTGKQVQMAHMKLAKHRREWPKFDLPEQRGKVRVADVLSKSVDSARDAMIREWCVSVWEAYRDSQSKIRDLFASSTSEF